MNLCLTVNIKQNTCSHTALGSVTKMMKPNLLKVAIL